MEERCWYYDVSELYDAAAYAAAMSLLPWPERRAKAERFVFNKDRCLCLGAGLLCAYALRKVGARNLAMSYGDHGKPYLQNHPNIHFNISHSGTMAVCAVSSVPVGIDVEEHQPYDEGVARLCFTDEELEWVGQQSDAAHAFTRLWTRKESYLKLLGTGLSKSANSFLAQPGSLPEPKVRFHEYDFQGYSLCLCTRVQGNGLGNMTPCDEYGLKALPFCMSMMTEDS